MSPAAVPNPESSLLSIRVTAGGVALDSTWEIASIDVWNAVGTIPRARLVFPVGMAESEGLLTRIGDALAPGTKMGISAGFGGGCDGIFEGIVVGTGLELGEGGEGRLVVEVAADAIRMTLGKKDGLFHGMSDAALMGQLIESYGLVAEVEATAGVQEVVAQSSSSDWELLTARAASNGLQVLVSGCSVRVTRVDAGAKPALTLTYGESILAASLTLAGLGGGGVCGTVRGAGSALAVPGAVVMLVGMGRTFSGPALIGGVHHSLREGDWQSTVTVGLSAQAVAEVSGSATVRGLQTGIVKQVAGDPAEGFRVLVTLPLLEGGAADIWARVAVPYASRGAGMVFFPEVGDEVVLAYLGDDPRFPVVLGSVYSETRAPAFAPTADNRTKAIATRSGLQLVFDDDERMIAVKTPGGQSVTLADSPGGVTLSDSDGNMVALTAAGIALNSASDVVISAKGDLHLSAAGQIVTNAAGDIRMEALNVGVKAQEAFAAEGRATAEVKASGMLTLQAALVKIN